MVLIVRVPGHCLSFTPCDVDKILSVKRAAVREPQVLSTARADPHHTKKYLLCPDRTFDWIGDTHLHVWRYRLENEDPFKFG